jgi:hypothetical protein
MRLIIAGGRDYELIDRDYAELDRIFQELGGVTEVVEGGQKGADACGKDWALRKGLSVSTFHPDWTELGHRAGPERNRDMAEYAAAQPGSACVLFPGGKGTASMATEARRFNLRVYDLRNRTPDLPGQGRLFE